MTSKKLKKVQLARAALDLCEEIYEETGEKHISLDKVAKRLGTTKEKIAEAFDYLVEQGILSDDGDRDHLNFDDVGYLLALLYEILKEMKENRRKKKKKIEVPVYT
ncbi:MAG: hypothetical protein ACFFDT_17570 [Candidatus Hodarchaeota archaeon]